ncbi:glycerate kinase [Alicyclobacillus cycloheptanicus]|uniref:Glycerate kinase n=1 Tax=Alicyclobacillus cycloheptanicus TaxID=1457 RepID=A0ABT9XG20_9BACL|nr:glycerate kinase [Alicyclobacillus cycloheptanicus]MDQ0188701.1 glycerate kinase [Alicyclobacillus cycloheptanicus]WDM00630.1 glycerate kinase [Alicyclobacillus cycloheptanicus]
MRVVIAPDSFKGTLCASAAAEAVARGLRRAWPDCEAVLKPMADGGEGTQEAVLTAIGGERIEIEAVDPLGRTVSAAYALLPTGEALIELASASGLTRVEEEKRDAVHALAASTYGTGQLIRDAIRRGAARILLTLGGSATSDGGYGLLAALGARYYDADGQPQSGQDASELATVERIDAGEALHLLRGVEIRAACDVNNPLCGPLGAASVYGPQKGLDAPAVARRDAELRRFAALLQQAVRTQGGAIANGGVSARGRVSDGGMAQDVSVLPGIGAAGGASLPLVQLAGAALVPGAELVGQAIGLPEAVGQADLVITGEGRSDAQSAMGKVPAYVGRLAEQAGKPCLLLSGALGAGYEALLRLGITKAFAASPAHATSDELRVHAAAWLEQAAAAAAAVWQREGAQDR